VYIFAKDQSLIYLKPSTLAKFAPNLVTMHINVNSNDSCFDGLETAYYWTGYDSYVKAEFDHLRKINVSGTLYSRTQGMFYSIENYEKPHLIYRIRIFITTVYSYVCYFLITFYFLRQLHTATMNLLRRTQLFIFSGISWSFDVTESSHIRTSFKYIQESF
jgi:hypothetical protein